MNCAPEARDNFTLCVSVVNFSALAPWGEESRGPVSLSNKGCHSRERGNPAPATVQDEARAPVHRFEELQEPGPRFRGDDKVYWKS